MAVIGGLIVLALFLFAVVWFIYAMIDRSDMRDYIHTKGLTDDFIKWNEQRAEWEEEQA